MVARPCTGHPALLVKAATTLDVLSGGRTYLGLGAAWYEREAHGLGLPCPPRAERFERLEETLRIALAMWAGDPSPSRAATTGSRSRSPTRAAAAPHPDHDRWRR